MNKISWLGTISSVAGSFAIALKFYTLGYALFLLGSISWLVVGFSRRDVSLITLNSAFFTANIIGVYNV